MINNLIALPTGYCLVTGRGDDEFPLCAFDQALCMAGLGGTNLVRLSSTLNPNAIMSDLPSFHPGGLVAVAYAHATSAFAGQQIAAAIALVRPSNRRSEGVIMEWGGNASTQQAERRVIAMAEKAMQIRQICDFSTEVCSIELYPAKIGCCFAAVVQF